VQTSDKVTPEFDQYAASYEALLEDPIRDRFARGHSYFHRRKWILIDSMFKRFGIAASSQRWLDVGCGRGDLLELAGSHFAQAVGCDPSAGMLSSCTQFNVFQQRSQSELPLENSSVDFVTAVCVYHHVHPEARLLLTREIRRVLSPGGMCCIIEHNPWNPVTRSIVKRCPVDVDARLLSVRDTAALLHEAGFELRSSDFFLYMPERLFNRMHRLEAMLSGVPLGGQYVVFAQSIT